jgi:hypothetical protein
MMRIKRRSGSNERIIMQSAHVFRSRGGEYMCDSIFSVLQKSRARSVVIFNSSDACCIKNERLSVCIEVSRASQKKSNAQHQQREAALFSPAYKNIHSGRACARGKFDSDGPVG